MIRHFLRWSWWPVLLLLFCTLVGQIFRNLHEDVASWRFPAPPTVAAIQNTDVVRSDLLTRGPTRFNDERTPIPTEIDIYERTINNIISNLNSGGYNRIDFDYARMIAEYGPLQVYARLDMKPTNGTLNQLGVELRKVVEAQVLEMPWKDQPRLKDLVSIATSEVPGEVRILARMQTLKGGTIHTWYMRLWFNQSNSYFSPMVYNLDYADLHQSFLLKHARKILDRRTNAGQFAPGFVANDDTEPESPGKILNAQILWHLNDIEMKLDYPYLSNEISLLPPEQALQLVVLAQLSLRQNRPEEASKRLVEARKKWHDTPIIDLVQASIFNHQKQPDKALAEIKKYRQAIGNNEFAWREEARSHLLRKQPAAADKAIRAGLEETPASLPLLNELRKLIPAESQREIGEILAMSGEQSGAALQTLILDWKEDQREKDRAIIQAIVSGFRRVRPRDPYGIHEDALLKLVDRPNDVQALLVSAWDRWPNKEVASEQLLQFLSRASTPQNGLELYRISVKLQPEEVFTAVMNDLISRVYTATLQAESGRKALEIMGKIATEHRGAYPNSSRGFYYSGLHAEFLKDLISAEKYLLKAYALLPKRENLPLRRMLLKDDKIPIIKQMEYWGDVQSKLTWILFQNGKSKQAYEQLEPRGDTFDQLIANFINPDKKDKNHLEEMRQLAVEHRKRYPEDIEGLRAEASAYWHMRTYDRAADLFTELLQKSLTPQDRLNTYEQVIRCRIRAKSIADARKAQESMIRDVQMPFDVNDPEMAEKSRYHAARCQVMNLLVMAAEGREQEMIKELNEQQDSKLDVELLYLDPDLGPMLKTPAFEAFRKAFPEMARPGIPSQREMAPLPQSSGTVGK